MMIPLTRPVFGREESEAVAEVLESRPVAQGPTVRYVGADVDRFTHTLARSTAATVFALRTRR